MFIVFFDGNSTMCSEQDEAIDLANDLLANGYSYVTIANNDLIDVDADIEFEPENYDNF